MNFAATGDLRILVLLRLLRFLKLARYSPGMRSLITACAPEKRALGASAVIGGVILLMATAMHLAEHRAQPDRFGSIPQAMWWATITVTTVGYGDVVPVTAIRQIIASFAAVTGFLLLGLPVGIMATAFAEEIHRREFVVTWSMLARVPLFSELDAAEIAEVMNHLRAQTFRPGRWSCGAATRRFDVLRRRRRGRGRTAGRTRTDRRGPVLRRGGAVAGYETHGDHPHQDRTKLLALDAHDLQVLMSRNPQMRQKHRECDRDARLRRPGDARRQPGESQRRIDRVQRSAVCPPRSCASRRSVPPVRTGLLNAFTPSKIRRAGVRRHSQDSVTNGAPR